MYRTDRLEPFQEALQICELARRQSRRQAPHLDHPILCIDAMQFGIENGGARGIPNEVESFKRAEDLPAHRGLVHIFFAQRATKRVKGVTDRGLKPRQIKCVAVLGGGLMGSGIATACVLAGIDVILKVSTLPRICGNPGSASKERTHLPLPQSLPAAIERCLRFSTPSPEQEVNDQFLKAGLGRIEANLASRVKKGAMSGDQAKAAMARVSGALGYDDFKRADMVIEAVLEDLNLKQVSRRPTDMRSIPAPSARSRVVRARW